MYLSRHWCMQNPYTFLILKSPWCLRELSVLGTEMFLNGTFTYVTKCRFYQGEGQLQNTGIYQKFLAKQLLYQFNIYYFWWKNKPVVEMQVSRLSLLVRLLVLFLLPASLFLLLLLLFSPFSVRSILITCHVPSILVACLLPSICFVFVFFLLCSTYLSLWLFFSVRAYTNMQITVCVNMHAWTRISACVYKYFERVLIYKYVILSAMHRKISSVIECESFPFSIIYLFLGFSGK